MPPSKILDTHIHLWPGTATSPTNHAWMTPGHFLAKRHGISDYLAVTSPQPSGFVYVETDRYLPGPVPQDSETLEEWAKEPLEELRFLRRIIEGKCEESDGVGNGEGDLMKGCVVWAPFHLSPQMFQSYLKLAENVAGPALWRRIVGFRYLLQGKTADQIRELVQSEDWLDNITSLEDRWVFDVGVDMHRDGAEGLEVVAEMVKQVRAREGSREGDGGVRFVLNHLCKPNLSLPVSPRWEAALGELGYYGNVFMKLSGAFNEFDAPVSSSIGDMYNALRPFLDIVFANFPGMVMFGSDWPVCNVGGPKGEEGNWGFWMEVVEGVLWERAMSESDVEGVWWRVGERAYGIGEGRENGV